MRILMLGWEFPPHISGGLGTACHGLVRALDRLDVRTTFVLPGATGAEQTIRNTDRSIIAYAGSPTIETIRAGLPLPAPYPGSLASESPVLRRSRRSTGGARSGPGRGLGQRLGRDWGRHTERRPAAILERRGGVHVVAAGIPGGYGGDLTGRIERYADRCVDIADGIDFDVIHAHDWMTFPAGIAVARASGRPLVVHVHATEFDRSGASPHPVAVRIEREGVFAAARVIAVSGYTRRIIHQEHNIPLDRIVVVHNGIERRMTGPRRRPFGRGRTVLFLGRITRQKGPFGFVEAAAMLARRDRRLRFLVAGWGDLGPSMVEAAASAGLGTRMRFTGFLRGPEVDRAYQLADVYAMPSLSEPFGLTALEAATHGVPVVASQRSGVIEVLREGALQVDPDDPEHLADVLNAVLRRRPLADHLRHCASHESATASWDRAARSCVAVHQQIH